ncbi:DUF1772 domain-containing protein [Erythrobacter sp. HA6-11]
MEIEFAKIAAITLAIGAAMVGGVFQSFSDFVMRGLAEAGNAGAKGMQGLNRTVMRSFFLYMLFAMAPASISVALYFDGYLAYEAAYALWIGAGVYVASVPFVTMVGNVPMNNRLAAVDADTREGATYWSTYLSGWTRWNTMRTLGCYAAAACFAYAAISM